MTFIPGTTTLFNRVNIGYQSAYNTAASSYKSLSSIKFRLKPGLNYTGYPTEAGNTADSKQILGDCITQISFDAVNPKYSELAWIFNSVLNKTSTALKASVNGVVPKPALYTIQLGNAQFGIRVIDCYVNSFSIKITNGNVMVNGTIVGNGSITFDDHINVYSDISSVSVVYQDFNVQLDSTPLMPFSVEFNINNRWKPYLDSNSNLLSVVENPLEATAKFRLPASIDYTPWLYNGTTQLLQIYGGYLHINAGIVITDIGDLADENGIYAMDYTCKVVSYVDGYNILVSTGNTYVT